jgi:hypothetical protein
MYWATFWAFLHKLIWSPCSKLNCRFAQAENVSFIPALKLGDAENRGDQIGRIFDYWAIV